MILHQFVHEASIQDHNGGKDLLTPLKGRFPRLTWSGLRGVWVPEGGEVNWEQIRPKGFHVLKWRWIVERTFAWLSTWRRLAKDYELLPSSEEAWIYLAMIRIMLRRLAQNGS